MGWREKMAAKSKTKTHTINTINPKNERDQAFSSISSINSKGIENEKGYPIPEDELEFARDERQAIVDGDGSQDEQIPYSGPVDVVMDSAILGTVPVILSPDQAEVAGVEYSNKELVDLLSRRLTAAEIAEIHRIKQSFDGGVVPSLKTKLR